MDSGSDFETNDNSIVLMVDYGDIGFLLTSDAIFGTEQAVVYRSRDPRTCWRNAAKR